MSRDKPIKAYKDEEFLNSHEARTIRILSEYLEPERRFKHMKIAHTVVFFGSARSDPNSELVDDRFNHYRAAEELAFLLASYGEDLETRDGFTICTGGGPGIMEAANRGAERAGAPNIGLNISLPFEQDANPYITPELNFEFHYFFMRKLWFLYHAKAIIVFPGGYGTLDELFETLTLVQTNKMKKHNIPILLYDQSFWESLINFQKLVDFGMISEEDISLFHYISSPEEGLEYLKPRLSSIIRDVNYNIENNI